MNNIKYTVWQWIGIKVHYLFISGWPAANNHYGRGFFRVVSFLTEHVVFIFFFANAKASNGNILRLREFCRGYAIIRRFLFHLLVFFSLLLSAHPLKENLRFRRIFRSKEVFATKSTFLFFFGYVGILFFAYSSSLSLSLTRLPISFRSVWTGAGGKMETRTSCNRN